MDYGYLWMVEIGGSRDSPHRSQPKLSATVSHVIHWPHSSSHLFPWPQGSVKHPDAAQNVHRCTGPWALGPQMAPRGPSASHKALVYEELHTVVEPWRSERFDMQR